MRLIAILFALASLAYGEMHKVWELRIGDHIKEPAGWPKLQYHAVQAVTFSPDGKQIAVAVDDHTTRNSSGTHVLLIAVAAQPTIVRQYNVESCGARIEWAPGGEAILVCGYVLKLLDGGTCNTTGPNPGQSSVPPFARGNVFSRTFWLPSERVVRLDLNGISVLDEDCHGHVAMRDEIPPDYEVRKTPLDWPPKQLTGYQVIGASNASSRVLAELWGYSSLEHLNPLRSLSPSMLRRRVVWDTCDQREVASWKPQAQPYQPAAAVQGSANCALSPDGEYVAESGDGLTLYHLTL